jgi:hypothetical protein
LSRFVRNPRWGAVLVLVAGLIASAGSAFALEGEGFTMSNKTPNVKKDYGPIPGQNPGATAVDPTVSECNTLPSDVNVPITLEFQKEFGHLIKIQVLWEAPEANDVDIYLFDEAGDLVTSSASSSMPELVQLGSPSNGIYYLCVRNFSGPNTGFTVDATTRFLDTFVAPTSSPAPTPRHPSAPPKRTPQRTAAPVSGVTATSEPVDTPGPDGPFADQGLVRVAGDKQAAAADTGMSGLEIGLAALTGVIVLAGAGLVVFRIRRDTTPT